MSFNACFGLTLDELDIVVIEDAKPMQAILRSMLVGLMSKRLRMYDSISDAMQAMRRDPPNLIISDWRIGEHSASELLTNLRNQWAEPLCFVPVVILTAHATRQVVDVAMANGAHLVIAKPVSPHVLFSRIDWVMHDPRRYVLGPQGSYGIEGVEDQLTLRQAKVEALIAARAALGAKRLNAKPNRVREDASALELTSAADQVPVNADNAEKAPPKFCHPYAALRVSSNR